MHYNIKYIIEIICGNLLFYYGGIYEKKEVANDFANHHASRVTYVWSSRLWGGKST